MNTKHTPGPWRVSGGMVISSSSAYVIADTYDERLSLSGERRQNLLLIAAAPELLVALQQIATADYRRLDVATLGNIARAALAKLEDK